MPDRYGNLTGAEIMQSMLGQREDRLAQARTPSEARLARLTNLTNAIDAPRDPRVTQYTERERALRPGRTLTRGPDESAIDFELRQAARMFEDVKNVDPETAAQIASYMTQLEQERLQKKMLQVQVDAQEKAAADQDAMRNAELLANEIWYGVSTKTGKSTGESVRVDDPNFQQIRADALKNGVTYLPWDVAANTFDMTESYRKFWNASDYSARKADIDSNSATVKTGAVLAGMFNESLVRNGDVITTDWDKLKSRLIGYATTWADLKRDFRDERGQVESTGDMPAEGTALFEASREYVRDREADSGDETVRYLMQHGMDHAAAESLITTLAYTLARSFDARVTEADYQNARRIIQATAGNPLMMVSAINAAIGLRAEQTLDAYTYENEIMRTTEGLAPENYAQARVIQDGLNGVRTQRDALQGQYDTMLKFYGYDPNEPARAPGAAPRPAPVPVGGGRSGLITEQQ